MIDWHSPWIAVFGSSCLLAIGWRWAFHPERVIANSRILFGDDKTVRWVGYFMMALAAFILVVSLYDLMSE